MNLQTRWSVIGVVLFSGVAACSASSSGEVSEGQRQPVVSAQVACAHDVQCTGGPLSGESNGAGCTTGSGANGWCVQDVCADHPSCCSSAWDDTCVQALADYNKAGGYQYDDCPSPVQSPAPACSSTPPDGDDGTPVRRACTGNFGSGMSSAFGRLDGFLVSIIQPGEGSGCNGDAHHVHLQVQVKDSVYDIAVNVSSNQGTPNVDFEKIHAPLAGGSWSEGWHTGASFDYPGNLSAHSDDFQTYTPSTLTNEVTNDLTTVNHISVFTTGYGATGGHLIHRNGSNHDGALVLQPLSSSPQYLLFHFASQTF